MGWMCFEILTKKRGLIDMYEFYQGMAEILEIDTSLVNPDLVLEEYAWDSLAIVSTIALVDDCFDIMLDGKSLGTCKTIADISALVESKKG